MFFVAKELTGLPGLPATTKGIREALCRFTGGASELVRKRAGTKAFEYHIDCLPPAVQEAVRQRHYRSALDNSGCKSVDLPVKRSTALKPRDELEIMRKCPALLERKVQSLTDHQKQVADARMVLAQEVIRLQQEMGETRLGAVQYIVQESQNGTLPARIQRAADMANAKKGSTRKGVGKSSLQEWLSMYMSAERPQERQALLAPGQVKQRAPESIVWLPAFLHFYRDWRRPSVADAYESFEAEWTRRFTGNELRLAALPSIDAVRRALKKVPKVELMRGRVTGAEYKSMLPFVRRDWSALPVNGAWIGDGHGMKMEVIHPDTGKPFMAEITLVIEGPTRVVTGWSLGLAESQVAVGDALRHAISQYGVPLIYYSDNGGGEKNTTFDAEITGIFSRLGIDHPTGIPGNPQARGIIERLNKEIPKRVAKTFDSYVGREGDRESIRVYRKKIGSAVNAINKGKELTGEQRRFFDRVPTWDALLAEIEVQVQRHNNRPHDSLPKKDNGQHWSPLAYRNMLIERDKVEIDYLTQTELHEMFRPEVVRKAIRGEVRLFNNIYFNTELSRIEGEDVRVCFDIHDPNSVIIRCMDGVYVCDAIWDGNKVDAFPKAHMERLKEQRAQRRRQPLEKKLREIEEELHPVIELQPEIDINKFIPMDIEQPERISSKPYLFESEYEDDLKKYGNHR